MLRRAIVILLLVVAATATRESDSDTKKPTPWALTGKMFSRIFEKDVWIRDRYDIAELTVALDSSRCLFSVHLKPISSTFDVNRRGKIPVIPDHFDTYDTKLVASFKKGTGLQKRIVRVVKSLLAKGLSCGELKYVF
jgi:DNA-binding transcriptional ArsR family regulator